MADLIPFPRVYSNHEPKRLRCAQDVAEAVNNVAECFDGPTERARCANGMPGHPPCRSPAELEAMLAQRQALAMGDMEPDDVEGV